MKKKITVTVEGTRVAGTNLYETRCGYFLFEEDQMAFWTKEDGETFSLFSSFEDAGSGMVKIREKDFGPTRFFDKKSRRVIEWINEEEEKFSSFNSSTDYGNGLLEINTSGSRIYDRETRRAIAWRTEEGEVFYTFFRTIDIGSSIGITRKVRTRFFNKKTCELIEWETEDGKFSVFDSYCFYSKFIVLFVDGKGRFFDKETLKIVNLGKDLFSFDKYRYSGGYAEIRFGKSTSSRYFDEKLRERYPDRIDGLGD